MLTNGAELAAVSAKAARHSIGRAKAIICRFSCLLFFLAGGVPGESIHGQEIAVPVRVHYPMLLKALSFDRNLKTRGGDTLVLGVVYQSRFRQSSDARGELLAAIEEAPGQSIAGLPVRVVDIDLSRGVDLKKRITAMHVNTVYVAPLRAVGMKTITGVTRAAKVLSLTGVEPYVEAGLSLGVEISEDRPVLVVNLRASKAEGADLSSQLLELARIIR